MNAKDGRCTTALHMAAVSRKHEAAAVLLKRGASLTARNADRLTPLDHALLAPSTAPTDVFSDEESQRIEEDMMATALVLVRGGARIWWPFCWRRPRSSPLWTARKVLGRRRGLALCRWRVSVLRTELLPRRSRAGSDSASSASLRPERGGSGLPLRRD